MKVFFLKPIIYVSNILLLFSCFQSVEAEETNVDTVRNGSAGKNTGIIYNCGNQAVGPVTCIYDRFHLDKEKSKKIGELCSIENFGAIEKGVEFKTRKTYNVGEIINIEYTNACPYKTDFLIVNANSPYSPRRNSGMREKSVKVPDFNGEMRFTEDKKSKPGKYAIQAYYIDSQRKIFLGGRSLPFEVVNNR